MVAPTAADFATAAATPPATYVPAGNSIATAAQVDTVFAALDALVPKVTLDAKGLYEFLILAGDIGTSSKTVYPGSTSDGKTAFGLVASVIKNTCTVRQFCSYYAKLVYVWYKANRPPANWARKGYTDEAKYAAFDFFDGVVHPAALSPASGDPAPSVPEIIANQANRRVVIFRSNQATGGTVSTLVELTGGRASTTGTVRLALPPPPSS
jgi:hypothetical protein